MTSATTSGEASSASMNIVLPMTSSRPGSRARMYSMTTSPITTQAAMRNGK